MKAAGCIVIGKTNTPEFGLGSHTFNEVFGTTRNAYDPSQVGRRQQRRRGGVRWPRACCRWPTAATSWAACATRPAGTTCSACGRARAACRCGRRTTSASRSSAPRGRWARTVQDVAMLLDVQAGYDARAPLSLADGARFAPCAGRPRSRRRYASAGSATSAATCRWSRASSTSASRRLRTLRGDRLHGRADARSTSRPSTSGRRGWSGGAGWSAARIAPYLPKPANRALIKPEALWEHDQACEPERRAGSATRAQQRTAFYQQMLALFERFDVLALPTAQVWPFDASRALAAQIAGRDDGHLPPLDGGHDLRHVRRPAVHQRAGRLRRRAACRWACS